MRGCCSVVCLVLVGCTAAEPMLGTRTHGSSRVHDDGILDPTSPAFHGQLLARTGWDFPLCQTCHGSDFGGGVTGVTCLTCHADKPTSCATCHGASPSSGAHALHVLGGPLLGKRYACSECHVTPSAWDSPGHIRDADGIAITAPVRVTFGALAQASTRPAPPAFEAGRCTNVYCHDAATSDAAAATPAPLWSSTEAATCGTCHGQPPSGHPAGACAGCHGAVVDAAGAIVAPALHIVGKAALGDGSGTCQACHPTSALGGAHQSHVLGTHLLAAPIACGECHAVPAAVDAPGHFTSDGRAAVFPIGGTGPLASANGAAPRYAADAMQCTSTYCHGSGVLISTDASSAIVRDPSWQPGSGAGRCGTCHGLPPLDGVHDPAWQITQCAACHGRSVDAFGQIIVNNGVSTHLDGVVDAP